METGQLDIFLSELDSFPGKSVSVCYLLTKKPLASWSALIKDIDTSSLTNIKLSIGESEDHFQNLILKM